MASNDQKRPDRSDLVAANIRDSQKTAMRQEGGGRAESERPASTMLRTTEFGQKLTVSTYKRGFFGSRV